MKKYDIFLVDADNTVLDFHASSRAALKAAFESFGKAWTEEYAKKFSVFNDSLWERLERKELTREKLLGERFPLFLKMLGMEDVSGESFNEKYIGYLATHPVYMEGARGGHRGGAGHRRPHAERKRHQGGGHSAHRGRTHSPAAARQRLQKIQQMIFREKRVI